MLISHFFTKFLNKNLIKIVDSFLFSPIKEIYEKFRYARWITSQVLQIDGWR